MPTHRQPRIIQHSPYGEYEQVYGSMGDMTEPQGYPGQSFAVNLNPRGAIVPTNGFASGAYARRRMSDSGTALSNGVLTGRQVVSMPIRSRGGLRGFGDGMALPSIPGLGPNMAVGFELRNNLWIVSDATRSAVDMVLGQMAYSMSSMGPMFELGTMAIFAGTPNPSGLDSVNLRVGQGFAALVNKASLATGTPQVMFTPDARTLANAAGGTNATWALLRADPAALIAQASALVSPNIPGTVPPAPPPGTTLPPAPPAPTQAPPSASSSLMQPPTVYYLAGAVGVLGLGAFLVLRKKSARMTPNRRR